MAPSQDATAGGIIIDGRSNKRNFETASAESSTTSSDDSSRKKKRRDRKASKRTNSLTSDNLTVALNGHHRNAFQKRRDSLSKAARDPRDEPVAKKRPTESRPPSPIPVIEGDGLSRPSRGTRQRLEETKEEAEERLIKMRGAVRVLLECIGEDPDREGLLATPDRYAKALLDLTKGYQVNVEQIINNAIFHEGHNEMVIVKDIEIHSVRIPDLPCPNERVSFHELTSSPTSQLCEHHMVPFIGKMHIGYIPSETVIGLSKLPRIAEMYARRLQIQERLTKEVAHAIMEILKPQGVAVVMESSHLCMVMRGVGKTTATTITSCVLGCFERKSKTRNEFLSLVGVNR
ncbi:hypothetical protein BGZ63DRAFT_240518 [Mariannaea sp. PMI_226]|nr:hypothetical protein BGZ63DRAFT_240518 [Mariannaea sp. PMI_226]